MKNELITQTTQLPDTIEDLTQFVLVGKSKLNAYMLKLRTVNRLSVAQEIRNQTLEETQELANALIAAEQRIGELLLSLPTAQGKRTDLQTSGHNSPEVETKAETVSRMGYGEREAKDYQQMAKNPDIVRKVIEDATANGEVVTKSAVMKEIQRAKEEAKAEAQAEMKGFAETIKQQSRREAKQEVEAELQALRQTNKVLKEQAEKTATVVAPEDYQEMKQKARAYDAEVGRLNEKLNKAYNDNRKLSDKVTELQEQTAREQSNNDFVAGSIYFVAQCGSFIRDVGGYVWIADKLEDLPEKDREGYIKAAMAVRDWATVLLQNIERNEYGKQEIERISSQSQ